MLNKLRGKFLLGALVLFIKFLLRIYFSQDIALTNVTSIIIFWCKMALTIKKKKKTYKSKFWGISIVYKPYRHFH